MISLRDRASLVLRPSLHYKDTAGVASSRFPRPVCSPPHSPATRPSLCPPVALASGADQHKASLTSPARLYIAAALPPWFLRAILGAHSGSSSHKTNRRPLEHPLTPSAAMYDYPAPASSSTPPSPHTRKHHNHPHRRSQSPLPHLSTLLPTGHHHHHEYSPSSRAADISRLLDPAYASSSSSSSTSASPSPRTPQTRAYVDHNGDLHDPDYRDFPVLPLPTRNVSTATRRRTSTGSGARSRSHERYSVALNPPRPSWERNWGAEIDESDDECEEIEAEGQSQFSPFASHHDPPRKNVNSNAYTPPSYTSPYYYFSDTTPTSSPDSYDDDNTNALQLHESPFGDDVEETSEESKKRSCLVRRGSKPKKAASMEEQMEKDDEEPSRSLRPLDEDVEDECASTLVLSLLSLVVRTLTMRNSPTCTHAFRQQWQAVSLRVRFGVFHAKRRLSRRQRT